MNCEDFKPLLADALGNELSEADRPLFNNHLDRCDDCRYEYESLQRTYETLRGLRGSDRLNLRMAGKRLASPGRPIDDRDSQPWRWAGISRYAASILIAFTAGYAFHAGLLVGVAPPPGIALVQDGPGVSDDPTDTSLQGALLSVHAKNPKRSDLAKCLIAMSSASR